MEHKELSKKQVSDLLSLSVGTISLDHKATSIETAFGLFESEINIVNDYIEHLRHNEAIKTRSGLVEKIWNSDKLALYQRIWAIYKYGYNKGKEDAQRAVVKQ